MATLPGNSRTEPKAGTEGPKGPGRGGQPRQTLPRQGERGAALTAERTSPHAAPRYPMAASPIAAPEGDAATLEMAPDMAQFVGPISFHEEELPTKEMSVGMELQADPMAVGPVEDRLEGAVVAVRYKVLRKIGEGGMGAVYLAEHVAIERKVALKVLLREYGREKVIKERFIQEAKAAAKIGHENIVDIIDFGVTPSGSLFFAMEHLEGQDLARLIQMEGYLKWSRAKPIVLQICRALEAAHKKGIIHRDMKPENIFLENRENHRDFVKVLDFGIAKVGIEAGGQRLTRTGMVFGTPQYMSPEQAQGKKPDNRVDVYSVGCIIYEMLTGLVPFKADSFMAVLTKHISETPVPPAQANPDAGIPRKVQEIVLRAMAKNPEDRFQSMAEMAVAVSRAPERETEPPLSPSLEMAAALRAEAEAPRERFETNTDMIEVPDAVSPPLSSNSRLVPALVGALVLLLGLVGYLLVQREKVPLTDAAPAAAPPVVVTPSVTAPIEATAATPPAKVAAQKPDSGVVDAQAPLAAKGRPAATPKVKKPHNTPRTRTPRRPRDTATKTPPPVAAPAPAPAPPQPAAPEPTPAKKKEQPVRDLLDPFNE